MPDPFDQTSLLCDHFYELIEPLGLDKKQRPRVRPGQLVWAHQVYPPAEPYIVYVERYDPRDESKSKCVVQRLDPRRPPPTHFPIKELGLRADENYYILQGKMRPAVVLQSVQSTWANQIHPEPYALVAPAFTFKPRHDAAFRYRVPALDFPPLFYLPAQHGGVAEPSVLRFEFIQPVALAGITPLFFDGARKQSALSQTAWAVLVHQLVKFFCQRSLDEKLEHTLRAYHDLVLEALRQAAP